MAQMPDYKIPPALTEIGIRPLSKGMILNSPSQQIPEEALVDAMNLFVTPEGLKKRGGFEDAFNISTTDTPLRELGNLWLNTGLQKTWLAGQKYLYDLSIGTATPVYSSYATGTVSVSGLTVTGSGTSWEALNLKEGDKIILDLDESGDGAEEIDIAVAGGDTVITLASTPVGTYGAGTDYVVRKIFQATYPQKLLYEVVDNKVIFTDFNRPPEAWDGSTTMGVYSTTISYIFSTLCYWKERLWGGRVIEDDGEYRARVRWTTATDRTNFPIDQYQELDYTPGAIQRIIGLGELLVVFLNDAIYYGTPSNIPSLPAVFTQIETGGIGLIGQKALAKYLDGCFFVGQDNIYYLSSKGVDPMGDSILQESLFKCTKKGNIQLVYDPKNECLWAGFPIGGDQITDIFIMNIRSKGWSRVEADIDTMASLNLIFFIDYNNWVATPYTTGTVTTVDTDETVEGTGVDWVTAGVEAGDYVLFDPDSEGVYYKYGVVDSVTDLDTLELVDPVDFSATDIPYKIVKSTETYASLSKYLTYDNIKNEVEGLKDFYITQSGLVKALTDSRNDSGSPIRYEFVTKDFDFNLPDRVKFFNRLTFKLRESPSEDITFNFYGSTDKGRTWKHLGANTIPTGRDETRIDFRMTGVLGRFKVSSDTSLSAPFTGEELVIRTRAQGIEIAGRNG